MDFLIVPLEAVRDFLELGGDVLTIIAVTIFMMWVLIVERLIYFRTGLRVMAKEITTCATVAVISTAVAENMPSKW